MNEAGTGLAKVALIALMAVGSIFLWIGIPLASPNRGGGSDDECHTPRVGSGVHPRGKDTEP